MRLRRILYLAHRLPYPPDSGAKIRAFQTIRHLNRDNDVTVTAPARSIEELERARALRDHCQELITEVIARPFDIARMVLSVPTARPSSMGYFHSTRLARRVRELCATRPFDLILVHCSSVAPYVVEVNGAPKILDFVDMDSQKWLDYAKHKSFPLSLGYRLEGHKMARAEARLASQFDMCICATEKEVETLRDLETGARAAVVPNGVDFDYFMPRDAPYVPDSICFVGRMDYFPNAQCMIDFCTRVLPRIRQARANATMTIVGAAPPRAVRQLAQMPGVTVSGTVDDVRPFVQRSAVSVAPLKIARGTQNKILESMAMGVPVVASSLAAGGVDAQPQRDLLVADSDTELADAVTTLLGDDEQRQRIAQAGHDRVKARHSWQAAMSRLEASLQSHWR